MSKTFNFYLKNSVASNSKWGEVDLYAVGCLLKELFDKVCQHPDSAFCKSDYWWDPSPGTIKDHELLVYFLPTADQSVIVKDKGVTIDKSKSGNTFFRGLNIPRISEIYVIPLLEFKDRHRLMANLCFHELMHNKLEPLDIHTNGGGGLATDQPINSSTELTAENKKLMANALDKKVPQHKRSL